MRGDGDNGNGCRRPMQEEEEQESTNQPNAKCSVKGRGRTPAVTCVGVMTAAAQDGYHRRRKGGQQWRLSSPIGICSLPTVDASGDKSDDTPISHKGQGLGQESVGCGWPEVGGGRAGEGLIPYYGLGWLQEEE